MMSQEPAAFRWWQLALGLPVGVIHGLLIAWLAVTLQGHFAPWLLFPVLLGLLLGATLVALPRLSQVGNRVTILLVAAAAALTAFIGQHYLSYQYSLQAAREEARLYQKAQQIAPMLLKGHPLRPANSLAEFLCWEAVRGRHIGRYTARNTAAWLSWGLDGILLVIAALALVVPALKQPYCDQCQSWFRTTRAGRVDLPTARLLASAVQVPVPEGLQAARYRLVGCNGGCRFTGLALYWEAESGPSRPVRLWLDVERRNRVVAVLDAAVPSAEKDADRRCSDSQEDGETSGL